MNLALRPHVAGSAFVLSMYVLACFLTAGYAAAAENAGQEGALQFAIRPQGLESALALFSEMTGYSILIGGDLVAGLNSQGASGEMSPRQALERLLQDTGLTARFVSQQSFTLAPVSVTAPSSVDEKPDLPPRQIHSPVSQDFSFALQRAMTRALCELHPNAFGRYRLGLQLWLAPGGTITDVRLLTSSGAVRRDRDVAERLQGLDIGVPLPVGMAQPLTVLLTPRPDPAADCRYFSRTAP